MPKLKTLLVAGAVVLAAVIGFVSYTFNQGATADEKQKYEAEESSPVGDSVDVEVEVDVESEEKIEKDKAAAEAPPMPEIKEYDQDVVWKSGYEIDGKQKLKKLHDFYNQLLGWGEADEIYWSELDGEDMRDHLRDLHTFVEPSKMDNDLKNAEALLELALARDDVMSLRFVHRILHDLDHYINGTEVDGVWKVTDSFNGDPGIVEHHLFDSKYFAKK